MKIYIELDKKDKTAIRAERIGDVIKLIKPNGYVCVRCPKTIHILREIEMTKEQLPDTTELQAENEVLRLALELAIDNEPISCSKICGHDNDYRCQNISHLECIDNHKQYFIDQASTQIVGGKK